MSKLDKVTYVHTLVIGSIHEYKLNGPHGSDCPIGARGGHLCFPGFGGPWTLYFQWSEYEHRSACLGTSVVLSDIAS